MPTKGRYDFTINTGVVSTEERNLGTIFQFDATMNYGNSGGPVIGMDGRFMGIATMPMSDPPLMGILLNNNQLLRWKTALNSGASYAARADQIISVLPQLKKGESILKFEGPYIGVAPDGRYLLSNIVKLGQVVKASPAEKAGLKKGDTIVSIDGESITSWKQMLDIINGHKIGDELILRIKRREKKAKTDTEMEIKVVLGERK
jgi:serine protease Do